MKWSIWSESSAIQTPDSQAICERKVCQEEFCPRNTQNTRSRRELSRTVTSVGSAFAVSPQIRVVRVVRGQYVPAPKASAPANDRAPQPETKPERTNTAETGRAQRGGATGEPRMSLIPRIKKPEGIGSKTHLFFSIRAIREIRG